MNRLRDAFVFLSRVLTSTRSDAEKTAAAQAEWLASNPGATILPGEVPDHRGLLLGQKVGEVRAGYDIDDPTVTIFTRGGGR